MDQKENISGEQRAIDLERYIKEHKSQTIDLFNLLESDHLKKIKELKDKQEDDENTIKNNAEELKKMTTAISERDKELTELLSKENENNERNSFTIMDGRPDGSSEKKYKEEIAKLNGAIAERDDRIEELSSKILK